MQNNRFVPSLPHVRQSVVGGDGVATQPWYAWFGRIQSALNAGTISDDEASAAIAALATALGSPDGTVANIPPFNFLPKTTKVNESDTIAIAGSLAGGSVTPSVKDDSIANPKLANMAASTIKARKTGSTGDPEDCTVSEVLDFVAGAPTKGDLLARDTSAMARIAAGTAGHVLTSNGAGALPSYQAGGGGGGSGTFLGTATVSGSAATVLTLSGLDLSLYKSFRVEFALANATVSVAVLSLYFNADTTATNYYSQSLTVANTSVAGTRANTALLCSMEASETATGELWIKNDRNGRPRSRIQAVRAAPSFINFQDVGHVWTSATNVIGITISSSVANALAIGSTFSVFGVS